MIFYHQVPWFENKLFLLSLFFGFKKDLFLRNYKLSQKYFLKRMEKTFSAKMLLHVKTKVTFLYLIDDSRISRVLQISFSSPSFPHLVNSNWQLASRPRATASFLSSSSFSSKQSSRGLL